MKRTTTFIAVLAFTILSGQFSFAQELGRKFKMEGKDPVQLAIDQTFSESTEIEPFDPNVNKVYGLSVTAQIHFRDESGLVRFILVDKNHEEYLIYESYPLKDGDLEVNVEEICEETSLLKNDVKVNSVKIEIENADVTLKTISFTRNLGQGINLEQTIAEIKKAQIQEKVKQLNNNLQEKGKSWIAGITNVSELSWSERKKLFGNSKFPAGFEFYAGGVFSTSTSEQLKSATASPYVDEWDWRNRHGKNWISPIKNQSTCGSCWAFAATGATEAIVNVYYNQILNLDLSEQDVLSCSGGGDCNGGYPSSALNYITTTGVVNEAAFPYNATYQSCSNKSASPADIIKIGGKIDFGSTEYPNTEDDLKRMLIQKGPISGGLYDWSHAMVLVGYKVVKEGDNFYYRDLSLSRYWKTISAGDPLIGKTVWIFKNSWGPYFGDAGYVYVETAISNMGWTHALKTPVSSRTTYNVICEDKDGDGYYWWGLGAKPANSPGPALADGDDSDATKGPLDQYGFCIPLGQTVTPVANFSVSKNTITAGETVSFTDLSSNIPTTWSWSFPGGNPATSSAQNPSVSYSTPGIYDVTLTATNSSGSNSKTITGYIVVNNITTPPVADFTADYTTIEKGTTINFSDKSSNNPTSWQWSIKGAATFSSTLKNPSVKFDNAGTYDVALTVSNDGGANSKTVLKYITVTEPQSIPAEYCVPALINSTTDYIANVVISNGVKNASAGTGYSLYDGGLMKPGAAYTFSFTPKNTTARYYWRIWMDYNGDGDFADSGETVLSAANKKGIFKSTVTIPASITSSGIRMRVSLKTLSYAALCEDNFKGEIEDYQILVGQPAASNDNLTTGDTDIETEEVTTDVNEIDFLEAVKIYPNPVSSKLNIDLKSTEIGDTYSIYNINGSRLMTNAINSGKTEIDVTSFSAGIYIVEIKNGAHIAREKVVKH